MQNFYQRILADSPDEALDKAEAMLVDRSLLSYYDEVVLGGLKLAADDEARGTLGRERARALNRTVMSVIRDLDDHAGGDAAPSKTALPQPVPRSTAVVACIGGRGPFDEAISAMMVQLLTQRGIETRRIPSGAVARDAITQIDFTGVRVAVLCYLAVAGTPAHVRYLVRRIRQQVPDITIVLGLWPEHDPILQDAELQGTVGADRFVTSLDAALAAATELLGGRATPAPQEDRKAPLAASARLATR